MGIDFKKLKEELSKNPGMMLEELSEKIGSSFGIKAEIIKSLLENEATASLSSLKNELGKDTTPSKTSLSESQLGDLLAVISGGKELIKQLSKKEIEELKGEIIPFSPSTSLTEKFFSTNLVLRAKNPKYLPDHISGACLGIINSTEKLVHLLYLLGKGILQTPLHIYLIVQGKAEYDEFQNI